MPQQVVNLQTIVANQAAWDAVVQANFTALKLTLRTLKMVIATQGSHLAASKITIQLQDANGVNITTEQFFLRVRVCDSAAYPVATHATMAATGGTTLAETVTAGKDLVFKSSAAGLIEINVTDATAETMTIRCASAPVQPVFANHNNSLDLTHG